MSNSWRPEGWENPYDDLEGAYYDDGYDAAISALRERGVRVPVAVKSMRWEGIVDGLRARIGNRPGHLIWIPEDKG